MQEKKYNLQNNKNLIVTNTYSFSE